MGDATGEQEIGVKGRAAGSDVKHGALVETRTAMRHERLGQHLEPGAGRDGELLQGMRGGRALAHAENTAGARRGEEHGRAGFDGDGGFEAVAGEDAGGGVDHLDEERAGVGVPVGLAQVEGRAKRLRGERGDAVVGTGGGAEGEVSVKVGHWKRGAGS